MDRSDENMEQPNHSNSSTPTKRKRDSPERSESQNQQVQPSVTTIDDNLIDQRVFGLNLNTKATDQHFQDLVFIPEKVTPENDLLFPQVKMYQREDISISSLNQHTPDKGKKKLHDIVSKPQNNHLISDRNTSATCTTLFPDNQPMSDVGLSVMLQMLTVATHEMNNLVLTNIKNIAKISEDCAKSTKTVSLSEDQDQESNAARVSLIESIASLEDTKSRIEELRNEEKLRRIQQQQQQQQLEVGIANESHKKKKLEYKRRTEKATGKDQEPPAI